MDKIKEVQQILNNHALPTNSGGFIRDSLDGSKFNKIAQDIVKLFAIPDVVVPKGTFYCRNKNATFDKICNDQCKLCKHVEYMSQ